MLTVLISFSVFFSRGNTSSRRLTTDRDRESDRDRDRDRDSFSRWRDRQYFGPRRWLESALRDSTWDRDPGRFYFIVFPKLLKYFRVSCIGWAV